jgi:predicted ester cyclase
MADAEVAVIKRWFEEVRNQSRAETIDALLAPGAPVYGLKDAFPHIHFAFDEAISERDIVALRWTATATHSGDNLGMAATRKSVTITGMCFAQIRDGLIVEAWNNWVV